MLQPYPQSHEDSIDLGANADIEWLKAVIVGIRNIRGEMNIPPGKALTVLLRNGERERSTKADSKFAIPQKAG